MSTFNISELSEQVSESNIVDNEEKDTTDTPTEETVTEPAAETKEVIEPTVVKEEVPTITDNITKGSLATEPVEVTGSGTAPLIECEVKDTSIKTTAPKAMILKATDDVASMSTAKNITNVIGSDRTELKSSTGIVDNNKSVEIVKNCIKQYIAANTSIIKEFTTSEKRKCIGCFMSIMNQSLANPISLVFNEVYTMFKEHRTTILDPLYALQGIETLSREEAYKLQVFYQLFYNATDTNKQDINLDLVRHIFKAKGDDLVNYIYSKM